MYSNIYILEFNGKRKEKIFELHIASKSIIKSKRYNFEMTTKNKRKWPRDDERYYHHEKKINKKKKIVEYLRLKKWSETSFLLIFKSLR